MVMRVTNQLMQRNALENIFRISDQIFQAQSELTSGRRINKPSDNPAGLRDTLGIRTQIKQTEQFNRNIDFNELFINSGDSALDAIEDRVVRARELTIDQLGADSTASTRQFSKSELDKIISAVLQEANTVVKNQFVFGGTQTRTEPFRITSSGEVEYLGDTGTLEVEIARGFTVPLNLPGSEVLTTDLNPVLTTGTIISDVNGGAGASPGTFNITDRSGTSANVSIAAGSTIQTVINSINAAGLNVTASLNSEQNGILLTDSSGVITQALTVTEVGGGTTAADLGLLGSRNGDLEGRDLDPVTTSTTRLADLNGGAGLSLDEINIINGAASGVVTLSSAVTLGDVLTSINTAGFNVTASLNSQGNGLNLVSNDPTTVAIVTEVGTGTSASDLGIGGGGNVISTLIKLRDAFDLNDQPAIIASLKNLDDSEDVLNTGRAQLGAIQRRLDDTTFFHDEDIVDLNQQMGNLEDTNFAESASNLAQLEVALEATLNVTGRIIQPSLLNFLS